jgi:hypothetical protein
MALLNNKRHTVKRYEQALVDGVWTESEVDEFTVSGNLQPMTQRILAQFSEGFRTAPGAKWMLFTDSSVDLRIGGLDPEEETDNEPDRIIGNLGRLLYVHGVVDWSDGLIPGKYWGCIEAETESGGFTDV